MNRAKATSRRDRIFYGLLVAALIVCLGIPLLLHFRAMLFPKALGADPICSCYVIPGLGPDRPPLFITRVE